MIARIVSGGRAAVLAAAAAAFLGAPAALAADVTDIGFVDQGALAALPSFQSANRQFSDFGRRLQSEYLGRAKHASQAQQAQLAQEFQSRMAQEQQRLIGPLLSKAQVAIASVASSKNLSVVVDKRIVVFGGTDITGNVRDLLNSPSDPVPPVATPAPSSIGYVDQTAVDNVPKIRTAEETYAKFKADEDKSATDKLKGAKSDSEREAVLKDYRKTLDDEGDKVVKPVLDQTRSAISSVAKQKGLALVLDRTMVIFGGTDITSDVTGAIK